LLEFESGSNDPMAVFLTVGVIALITSPDFGSARFALMFVQQMTFGPAVGLGMGRVMVLAVNRLNLQYEELYPATCGVGPFHVWRGRCDRRRWLPLRLRGGNGHGQLRLPA
jgi:NhaP-type Na+/H+ or K+/H+ antiporter